MVITFLKSITNSKTMNWILSDDVFARTVTFTYHSTLVSFSVNKHYLSHGSEYIMANVFRISHNFEIKAKYEKRGKY